MEGTIYLDNNATTQIDPRALQAMSPYFLEEFGNPSSIHRLGQNARRAAEKARQQVAAMLEVRPNQVVFTSGGTESDNLAVRGAAYALRHQGRHIITSSIEHPAVLKTCQSLEKEGFEVTYLPVGPDGIVRPSALSEALRDDTILVSVMLANNETGALQPVAELARLAHERGIAVHTDAVQAAGKIPCRVSELGVDLLSISGHKFHGPKGVGALYHGSRVRLRPLVQGGDHERGIRSGTENVPGMVGLGAACEIARLELDSHTTAMAELRDALESGILGRVPEVVVNGSREQRMPQTSNLSFMDLEGEALVIALDLEGIAVSSGSACHAGTFRPSHVLSSMDLRRSFQQGAIRFSLSRMTMEREIERTLEILPGVVERVRRSTSKAAVRPQMVPS